VAAAVRMVRFPRDRTIIRPEAIRHRGQAVVAAATEAMACLQAPVREAAANHPDDYGSPIAPLQTGRKKPRVMLNACVALTSINVLVSFNVCFGLKAT
jgi:hypothetical protein